MKRPKPQLEPLNVTDEERTTLESWVRRRQAAHQDTRTAKDIALRAQIVLASTRPGDDDLPVSPHTVADRLGISYETAAKWRSRFAKDRLDGLTGPDAPFDPAKEAPHRP
ncbi:helix-turn-helix domain-containing protein [Streptomyces sp. NPDC002994]|uniref:helix-turn-helix domain-containing protein n=1 Tax=Streptomyces sp. NPDC002994 TaxID=3154441 RepID=UPI0033A2FE82